MIKIFVYMITWYHRDVVNIPSNIEGSFLGYYPARPDQRTKIMHVTQKLLPVTLFLKFASIPSPRFTRQALKPSSLQVLYSHFSKLLGFCKEQSTRYLSVIRVAGRIRPVSASCCTVFHDACLAIDFEYWNQRYFRSFGSYSSIRKLVCQRKKHIHHGIPGVGGCSFVSWSVHHQPTQLHVRDLQACFRACCLFTA